MTDKLDEEVSDYRCYLITADVSHVPDDLGAVEELPYEQPEITGSDQEHIDLMVFAESALDAIQNVEDYLYRVGVVVDDIVWLESVKDQ